MRTYYIYLIEEEVAAHFYGRESKFYELFAANNSDAQMNEIIQKQINYITKPLPYFELHRHLASYVQTRQIAIRGKIYKALARNGEESAEMLISKRCLKLRAWGGYDSESIFFEVLRKFDGRFLALDMEHNRYGWIKPMKERKYV